MKKLRMTVCCIIIFMFCLSAFSVNAAYESQMNDVKLLCEKAADYVQSDSDGDFTAYMSEKIGEITFESDKFSYLYSLDPELSDLEGNQLSVIVAVIEDNYINGGDLQLTQDDINKNVVEGYGSNGSPDDYQDDDAEAFMKIINDNKVSAPASSGAETPGPERLERDEGMPPEKNEDAGDSDSSSESGTSVGVVIFISIIVSAIVFVAGTYALRYADAKKPGEKKDSDLNDDDVFNLRLAVKSMQASLQKADGNFKELDKLRIQVDEIDEKLEHVTEYLRKLSKTE